MIDVVEQVIERHQEVKNEGISEDCETSVQMLHKIMQVANGVIHGTTHVMQQGEIDDYMGM